TFSIEFDASATPPAIVAKADLRDNMSGAKKKALVALGWKVSDGSSVKASVAAAALYLTGGLAAAGGLSRGGAGRADGDRRTAIGGRRRGQGCVDRSGGRFRRGAAARRAGRRDHHRQASTSGAGRIAVDRLAHLATPL